MKYKLLEMKPNHSITLIQKKKNGISLMVSISMWEKGIYDALSVSNNSSWFPTRRYVNELG